MSQALLDDGTIHSAKARPAGWRHATGEGACKREPFSVFRGRRGRGGAEPTTLVLNMIEDQNWQHTKLAKLKPMTNRTTMNPAALVTMDIRKTAHPQDGTKRQN